MWLKKKEKTIDPDTSTVTAHNNHTNYDMPVEHDVESNITYCLHIHYCWYFHQFFFYEWSTLGAEGGVIHGNSKFNI